MLNLGTFWKLLVSVEMEGLLQSQFPLVFISNARVQYRALEILGLLAR